MTQESVFMWVGFNLFVIVMLLVDLFVFHRDAHEVKMKEALTWSVVWVGMALTFNLGIYYWMGKQTALEFLTGYLIEKSLSVDNIFVFIMIFAAFKVPAKYQHRVLFWGILGALVMRAGFIAGGVTLIKNFHWIIYVFGSFLIFTGLKMSMDKDKEIHPEKNLVLKLFRKWMPVTPGFEGAKFFVMKEGRRFATPLFVVLILVETTDLIFAVDSIPAILSITQDPFIVYTSNVFAILGLRALYFALVGVVKSFHYLHYGLSAILVFVGTKMLLVDIYKIPIGVSLSVVASLLALSVIASLFWPQKKAAV